MWRVRWGGGVNHLRQSGLSGALWGARDAGGPAVASGGELGEQQQPADYARRFQTPEGIRQIAIPGKLVLDNSEVFTAAGLAGLGMLQGMRFFATLYRQRATGGSFAGLSGAASTVVAALSAPASLA